MNLRTFSSNPHRASTRTVLAEIGSLSVEFTRLAQLTKEPRYYDAVARITNEFEAWQNHTKIPGLWPTSLDASGCKKSDNGVDLQLQHSMSHGPHNHDNPHVVNGENPAPVIPSLSTPSPEAAAVERPAVPSQEKVIPQKAAVQKRQLAIESLNSTVSEGGTPVTQSKEANVKSPSKVSQGGQVVPKVDCEPQGLASPRGSSIEGFTLGAMADSVYEYLPKQYMLLGGLVPKYKTMYERAADAASKYLMFRAMVPENRNILVMGSATTSENPDTPGNLLLNPEQQHLLCFAGGMYAIGAKLFNRPADLEAAARLADGCVWAYESTTTGIMPESFNVMRCSDRNDCKWNETTWHEELDPYRSQREQKQRLSEEEQARAKAQEDAEIEDSKTQENAAAYEAPLQNQTAAEESSLVMPSATAPSDDAVHTSGPLAKRQLRYIDNVLPSSILQVSTEPNVRREVARVLSEGEANKTVQVPAPEVAKAPSRPVETPYHYPTHEEFVQGRIATERLSEGMTGINSKKYILR